MLREQLRKQGGESLRALWERMPPMHYLSAIRKRCCAPSMPLFPRPLEVGESP
jgi:hypothetical protein